MAYFKANKQFSPSGTYNIEHVGSYNVKNYDYAKVDITPSVSYVESYGWSVDGAYLRIPYINRCYLIEFKNVNTMYYPDDEENMIYEFGDDNGTKYVYLVKVGSTNTIKFNKNLPDKSYITVKYLNL